MRIAVVSPFVDRRHGTERALAELLERLAHKEHCEIHLYSQRVVGLTLTQPGHASPRESGAILWHRVPSLRGPHLLQFLAWLLLNSLHRSWDRWINRLRFDLVLSPGINCLDANVVIVHALFRRLREVALEEEAVMIRPGFLRGLHRRAYYALLSRLERHIYTNQEVALAAVSRRTAALLSHCFHRHDVQVIPNAVDPLQFSPSARLALRPQSRRRRNFAESDFVLLLIGNDWRVKGLETVLKAIGVLHDLPIRLIVAGDDSPGSFVEMAKAVGISERCIFETSRENVIDFYSAADLYVSPSREDSFGLPVVEAMACGLAAITSVSAGAAEQIQNGENGFVLRDPYDSQELAQLLEELFFDPQRRRRIGEAASKAAVEWSWDRNASAVYELLRSAAARR